jgi:hypothetical protein
LNLIRRIEAGQGEFLVFALTPPRLATEREQVQDIANTTIARLLPLDLDGLILYDIDDETERNPAVSLGGVAIPERHTRREDEHLRLLAKQAGCRFFVTQVVYDINAAKNLVSDYHYERQARGVPPVPFVFTFSICGSMMTLEFLCWLGVDVPHSPSSYERTCN